VGKSQQAKKCRQEHAAAPAKPSKPSRHTVAGDILLKIRHQGWDSSFFRQCLHQGAQGDTVPTLCYCGATSSHIVTARAQEHKHQSSSRSLNLLGITWPASHLSKAEETTTKIKFGSHETAKHWQVIHTAEHDSVSMVFNDLSVEHKAPYTGSTTGPLKSTLLFHACMPDCPHACMQGQQAAAMASTLQPRGWKPNVPNPLFNAFTKSVYGSRQVSLGWANICQHISFVPEFASQERRRLCVHFLRGRPVLLLPGDGLHGTSMSGRHANARRPSSLDVSYVLAWQRHSIVLPASLLQARAVKETGDSSSHT